jgi:hypothetical protein
LESWPALTSHFGINPTNFTAYSVAELRVYVAAIEDLNEG